MYLQAIFRQLTIIGILFSQQMLSLFLWFAEISVGKKKKKKKVKLKALMSKILSRKTEYFLSISIVTLLLLAFPGRSITFKEWTCWKTELCTFKINHGELVSNQAMDCSCTVCPTIAGTTCNLSRHFFLFFFFL